MNCNFCGRRTGPFAKIWAAIGYGWACRACFVTHSTYSTDPAVNEQFWLWHATGKTFPTG